MNIALEGTEEWVNGIKTNEYGDAFVRGNNGQSVLISCLVRHSLILLRSRHSVVHFQDGVNEQLKNQ